MLFLSIIIPVYKVEPYLRECLNNIAVSPLDCWEAILVDDGSPDGCPQICDEYAAKDSRFRVIHQENTGVAAARNAGLDAAQGEWIWFVDSDDVVNMAPVGKMVAWLSRNGNVDLVMFDLETFQAGLSSSKGEQAQPQVNFQCERSKNIFLMRHVCFHHQRLWYKKDLMDQYDIRFTRGVRLAEDLELQYKYLTLCQNPVKLNSILYFYRVREGSATQNSTYRAKAVEDLQIVIDNLAEWIRKYDIKPEPWLDFRIMKLFQNFLYSASLINENKAVRAKADFMKEVGIDIQNKVREIIAEYKGLGFPFATKMKYQLAKWNVKGYFMLNKCYLKFAKIK